MKRVFNRIALAIPILALATLSLRAQVGDPLPTASFKDFTQTEARSIEDFDGRLLLIEIFAYW